MTALRPSLPLGLAYVAAVLERAGHEVLILDAVGEAPDKVTPVGELHSFGLTPEEIADRIDDRAEVIGVTNMWSFSWPLVRRMLHLIRERRPEALIVAGGEHFTGMAEKSMAEAPIDYVILGEGDVTVRELMDLLARGERDPGDMPGVVFRREGRIVRNPPRPRIKAVDDLPWPAWHLFDVDAYNDNRLVNGVRAGVTIPILATRGCPYQCTYCSSPGMWTTRWYARDPRDVADEIEHYHERYGATNFPFQDLTAIIKKDWIVAFCREIIRRKLDITWQFPSGTRCEVIDDEVAELLRLSGGRHLAFAPESGSERTRKLVKKRMSEEGLLDAVRASVRHGLNITIFFVIGFPHDTKEDLRETARLARRLALMGVDDIAIGFFFPIPNTELYAYLAEKGRVDHSDRCLMTPIFANDEKLRPENNYCENLSARQLTWMKYRILLNFYPFSFAAHPTKAFRVLANVVRGRETRKLETWLVELKRKIGLWFATRFGRLRRSRREEHPEPKPGPKVPAPSQAGSEN